MIEVFQFCAKDGLSFEPYLTSDISVSLFKNITRDEFIRYYNGQEQGVKWRCKNKVIILLEEDMTINAWPTPDMTKVIAIYPIEHPTYPSPNNCVIYNEDGTVYKKLHPPKLISDLAKQFYRNPNGPHVPGKIFFKDISWRENSKGKIVPAVEIGFRREFSETRAYDVETGEFGEVLSTSKN